MRRAMAATLPQRLFIVRAGRASRQVFLTVDDGPHPEHTPRLLDMLAKYRVSATFFIVGMHAERFPDLVKRMAVEGHELGNHSFFHRDPKSLSAKALVIEVQRTADLVREITGEAPVLFRPPHGKLTVSKLLRLWAAGQTVVLWNVDPKDFASGCKDIAEFFRQTPLRAGDIALFHDNVPHAAAIVPALAASAKENGLTFATVSRLIEPGFPQSNLVRRLRLN
jgi:peptidoglycan/xylan/chitin deacetylase (PgdA/CDA1 family)